MAIVVLDPGHGGTAKVEGSSPNNATGPTGLKEKTVTLDLARRAQPLLAAKGHQVKLTRSGDTNLGLAARAAVAKAAGADAFVSIHFNGFNGAAQGTETWTHSDASADSKALAAALQKRLLAATGLKDRKVQSKVLGCLKASLHAPRTAACLAEISFMDVPAEEARLKTDAYKDKVAQAIADGIDDWLKADGRA